MLIKMNSHNNVYEGTVLQIMLPIKVFNPKPL